MWLGCSVASRLRARIRAAGWRTNCAAAIPTENPTAAVRGAGWRTNGTHAVMTGGSSDQSVGDGLGSELGWKKHSVVTVAVVFSIGVAAVKVEEALCRYSCSSVLNGNCSTLSLQLQ